MSAKQIEINVIRAHKINVEKVPLRIKNTTINFELDTGAERTIVPMYYWRIMGSPEVVPSKLNLSVYGGAKLPVKGEFKFEVNLGGKKYKILGILVTGKSIPLLGKDGIRTLKLDVNKFLYSGKISQIHSTQITVHKIYNTEFIQKLRSRYSRVFSSELGHCSKIKAHISLVPNAVPKFCKSRQIPFALADKVKDELERNISLGILEKIDFSEWATPIVPVVKPTGAIRICGDFKVTLNPQMLIPQHPIPIIDDLMAKLSRGEKFTKIDLADAYLQVELDEDSKKLVAINTPYGLFRYNRLPFGVANAPSTFQALMDQILTGIPGTAVYLDDIIVTGNDETEHMINLESVLKRLEEYNLHIKAEKCKFFEDSIEYLGYIISNKGKEPNPERLRAIEKMPEPTNIKELESFLGKVNYYCKFIPNFSALAEPLNNLRRKDTKFNFDQNCTKAFKELKKILMSTQILAHFDPKLPIILATDASDGGVGAVISHRYSDNTERPIAYASMTLNKSERNYSQVEKEALAIIYGVKKFYNYLAGRKFEIITDHKPLTTIFNPSKSLPVYALNRLQRWAMILMSFNYTIKYKSTAEHCNADCLSRLPAGNDEEFKDLDSIEIAAIHTMIWDKVPVSATKVAECTKKDEILNRVMDYIKSEWRGKIHPEIETYYKIRDQLSIQNDIILRDTQVVIPAELRKQILETLHAAHVGSVRMKKTAREYCWWPNINNDIARLASGCKICASHAPNPTPEYESWPEPKSVWSRVHMDFADLWDGKWLIVIDAKSKFPFAIPMGNNTTASSLIDRIDQIFGLFGFPELIVTDNGPPFQSKEVLKYYEAYGIRSLTIAPYHPASNGIAERCVRSFKDSMKKMREEGYEKMYAVRTFLRGQRIQSRKNSSRSISRKRTPINVRATSTIQLLY